MVAGGHRRTNGGHLLPSDLKAFLSQGGATEAALKVESCKSLRTSLQLFEQSPGASQAHSGQDDRLPADVPFPAIPNTVLFQTWTLRCESMELHPGAC